MIECAFDLRRGSFHLQLECVFASKWTVLFGPSGAGKSTLLRLVAGLGAQSQTHTRLARVAIDGRVLTDLASRTWLKPGRRQTSMVTQQPALFPHLSATANVAYGIRHLDRANRATKVREMLELVDAQSLSDRRPRALSGGEAQRVALARALAPAPRLLLLDEPFSALDGPASDALLSRLQAYTREHAIQTIMATHNASDALDLGAEVAILHDGRLTAVGPASQVLAAERERLLKRLNV